MKQLDSIHDDYVAWLGTNEAYAGIIDWLVGNYVSPKSDRGRRYSPDTCPWMVEPLKAAASGDFRIVSVMAAVGAGKSEMLTQFLCYALARAPGDTALYNQTDEDAKVYMESRFHPVVRAIEALKPLLPQDQDSMRRLALVCPTMTIYASGANESSTQSKSCRYVVVDECWLLGTGLLTEALARTHSRRDGVALIVGQAGLERDEHDHLHNRCNKHEWGWICPGCSALSPYNFKQLIFTVTRTQSDELDRLAIADSVRLQCPMCQALYHEDDRYRLIGQYVKVPSNALPENIGYRISGVGLPHVKWSSIAIQHEEALNRMRVGDVSEMRQFKQKIEARPWQEKLVAETKIRTSGYSIRDYADGVTPAFPGVSVGNGELRLIAVDFQLSLRYAVVRAYTAAQDSTEWRSRLLAATELETDDQIEELRSHYGVMPACTFVDIGYDTHRIGLLAHKYGYRCLRGSGQEFWATQPGVKAYVSDATSMEIQGLHVKFNYFSSVHFRDILQEKLENDPNFEIPDDAPPKYRSDLMSEVREMRYTQVSAPKPRWVLLPHRTNDYCDCEVMLLAALGESGVV